MAYKIANWRWRDANDKDFILDLYSHTTDHSPINFDYISNLDISYDNNFEEYITFIASSKLALNTSITNITEKALIALIANAPEDDIYCVFRDLTENIWRGYLVPEQITIDNAPMPYSLILTFSDSIKKMSELYYKNSDWGYALITGDSEEISAVTAYQLVKIVLHKLNINSIYEDTDIWLNVVDGYIPSDYTRDTNSPTVFDSLYYFINSLTNEYQETCMDVLNEVCRIMHSVFYYSNDRYQFKSIDEISKNTFTIYQYTNLNGNYLAPTSISSANIQKTLDHTNIKILTGSTINFLPGVNYTELKFAKIEDLQFSPIALFKWDQYNPVTTYNVGGVYKADEDSPLYFEFEYDIFEKLGTDQSNPEAYSYAMYLYYDFEIYIKIGESSTTTGGYLLKRDVDATDNLGYREFESATWEESTGQYEVYHERIMIHEPNMKFGNNTQDPTTYYYKVEKKFKIKIKTPSIPESGNLHIRIRRINKNVIYKLLADNSIHHFTTNEFLYGWYRNLFNYMTVLNQDNTPSDITYSRYNDLNNYKILKFEGKYLNAPIDNSTEFLQIGEANTYGNFEVADFWFVDEDSTSEETIQNLFVKSVSEFCKNIRSVHNLNLLIKNQYLNYEDILSYDTYSHLIISHRIDYVNAECQTTAYQLEKGTITNEVEKEKKTKDIFDYADNDNNNYSVFDIEAGDDFKHDFSEVIFRQMILTAAVSTGTHTICYVDSANGSYYEGEYFHIIHKQSKEKILCRLTQDILNEDTDVPGIIDSDNNFPIGSEVLFMPPPLIKFKILSGHTTEYTVPITLGSLPDPTILSLNAMKRMVEVDNEGVNMNLVLEADLQHYNDVAIVGQTLKFSTDLSGDFITIRFQIWEDLL